MYSTLPFFSLDESFFFANVFQKLVGIGEEPKNLETITLSAFDRLEFLPYSEIILLFLIKNYL